MDKPPYLVSTRLVNIQSHKDTTLEFNEGITIVRAKNGTGKSVLFKSIFLGVNPEGYTVKERKSLLRWGAESGIVVFRFSDGYEAGYKLFPKGTLAYFFREKVGESPLHGSVDVPPGLISRLAIIVDKKNNFYANIIDQDQSLLFVKNTSTANSLVRMILTDEELDELLASLNQNLDEYNEEEKRLLTFKVKLESELRSLEVEDLTSLYRTKKIFENFLPIYEAFIEIEELSESLWVGGKEKDLSTLVELADLSLALINNPIELVSDSGEDAYEIFESLFEVAASSSIELLEESLVTNTESSLHNILIICEQYGNLEIIQDNSIGMLESSMLEILELGDTLVSIYNDAKEVQQLKEELYILQQDIERESVLVEGCPIYGAVRHAGDICIPVDN
jgi:hypothetical protein